MTKLKTITTKKPTTAIGESGSTSRTAAAARPMTPSVTLALPKPLPKLGAPRIATPRPMTPSGRMTSPVTSSMSMIPWMPCHQSKHRLVCRGRARCLVQVPNRDVRDMRERAGCQHPEATTPRTLP